MDARWIDGWLLDRAAYPLSLIAFEIKRAECVCSVTPVDPEALARLSLSKISHSIPIAHHGGVEVEERGCLGADFGDLDISVRAKCTNG